MLVQKIKLRQLADARSGDKGGDANVGVIAHGSEGYELLEKELTADKVQAFFEPLGVKETVRYEVPNLLALNFILKGALDGGGSTSLRLDPQGKSLGQMLLEMTLDVPVESSFGQGRSLVSAVFPEQDICILTLNRPEKRNALNVELLEELCAQLDAIAATSSIRALIVAAEGPSFCSGMDLNDAIDPCKVESSAALIARLLTALVSAPFVTIAAAQGVAAGGGAGILSACDLVVASNDLQLSYPEVRRGLVPAQVAPLLLKLVPRRLVHELLFTGEPLNAEHALSAGLVNKVVHREYLLAEALQLAAQVQRGGPNAIRQTKWLLRDLDRKTFAEDLGIALPYHHQSRHSDEAKEGSTAFFEKRPPVWEGIPQTRGK